MDEQNNLTKFENVRCIEPETKKFDPSEYEGEKVKIAKVEEDEGNFGPYVRVITEPVHEYEHDGVKKGITGSRFLGLSRQDDGSVVWFTGSKMDLFLKKHKVEHYNDLIGKTVVIRTEVSKDGEKEFLTF
jgi:hypothetical protein